MRKNRYTFFVACVLAGQPLLGMIFLEAVFDFEVIKPSPFGIIQSVTYYQFLAKTLI